MCSFWWVIIETCGLALSGRRIRPILLTIACCLRISFWCISIISLQYFSSVRVSTGFYKAVMNLTSWEPPNRRHNFLLIEFRLWEVLWSFVSFQLLNVYNCRSESTFHRKLQFDREKDHFGWKEKGQTRFQNVCVYKSSFNLWETHFFIYF